MAEDQARRKSRHRAVFIGVISGFVTSFFGGFVAFAVIGDMLNRKLDHGIRAALFFASIFGGALLGAVICGLAVNWWYGWRSSRRARAEM
jgi:cytochrome c biogenesis protein CcdA